MKITKCAVHFYEGEATTENEFNEAFNLVPVTRYRRSKQLKQKDLPHFKDTKTCKDSNGYEYILFNEDDFGKIKTDDELRDFLDEELFKDTERDSIPEQDKRILNKVKR